MKIMSFIGRSLLLSISVTFRMLAIIAVAAFAAYMLFRLLSEQPIALIFVIFVLFVPTLMFLYLNAIRAGLVALKASGPPNVKKLFMGTLKLSRFNMMLNNLILTLIGLGGSVLFLKLLMPELWTALTTDLSFSSVTGAEAALETFGRLPSALPVFWALAISISVGVVGTSSGAVAASSAEDGPNHDAVWGVTQQFVPLFALASLLYLVPTLLIVLSAGGPFEPLFPVLAQPLGIWGISILYFLWSICAICAGKAIAYVHTVDVAEQERQQMHADMLGQVVDTEDLRALRLARQEKAKLS